MGQPDALGVLFTSTAPARGVSHRNLLAMTGLALLGRSGLVGAADVGGGLSHLGSSLFELQFITDWVHAITLALRPSPAHWAGDASSTPYPRLRRPYALPKALTACAFAPRDGVSMYERGGIERLVEPAGSKVGTKPGGGRRDRQPPSTGSVTPVMNSDRSEVKNATA